VSFIVDSSVSLSWCFEDERTPATKALLERVGEGGTLVPQHWPLEVLNGLMMAERRQRIDAPRRQRLADFLCDLPITLDTETTTQVWRATQRLAERFRLTIYDAVYLELAQRKHLPLASLDEELRRAGASLGVTLLGSDPEWGNEAPAPLDQR
jgi:predicted nucleic acid-binding protein